MSVVEEAINGVRALIDEQVKRLEPSEVEDYLRGVIVSAEARFFKFRQELKQRGDEPDTLTK